VDVEIRLGAGTGAGAETGAGTGAGWAGTGAEDGGGRGLTQIAQPALELLHGGLEAGLLEADHQAAARVEDVVGVHRLQLDLHAQLLQYPQEVQHEAVRGHQLVVRLGGGGREGGREGGRAGEREGGGRWGTQRQDPRTTLHGTTAILDFIRYTFHS